MYKNYNMTQLTLPMETEILISCSHLCVVDIFNNTK